MTVASQRLLIFLSFDEESGCEKEINKKNIFNPSEKSKTLNLRRYKLFNDTHMNEYIFCLNYHIWSLI